MEAISFLLGATFFFVIVACLVAFANFDSEKWFEGFFFLALVVVVSVSASIGAPSNSYRQGQIDAANGKMKYVQARNDDGEVVWVEKKGDK